jgi:GT2 family glycosyltransferase
MHVSVKSPPSVSIICPLHNKVDYIAETIRSVLAQSTNNWELIVVENHSTDDGPKRVVEFDDSRIRFVDASDRVYGPGAARNAGLDIATGDWVLFLDADDTIGPNYLRARLADSMKTPEASVIVGPWQEVKDGEPISSSVVRYPSQFGKDSSRILESAIAVAPWIIHAAITKRSWLDRDRRWAEQLDGLPSEDVAFWFAALLDAKIGWSDDSEAVYRIDGKSSRESTASAAVRAAALTRVVNHNLQVLSDKGRFLVPKQCEILMRAFENVYRFAMNNGAVEAAEDMRKSASYWLSKCSSRSVSVMMRRVLGLQRFNYLRFDV